MSRVLVANARMYAVTPAVAAAWRELLDAVALTSGVPLASVGHAAPAPLEDLWRRADLGCALMCGYPWATWSDAGLARPRLLAVPAARGTPAPGTYRSEIVVRAAAPFRALADLRGARFAWTTPTSQSGYQAPRALFAPLAGGAPFFGGVVGPTLTPRALVEALLAGDADAGALDGYWLQLLRLHEPATAQALRTIACTPWTAAPAFACAGTTEPAVAAALADALQRCGRDPQLARVRTTLALADIVAADPGGYEALAAAARAADALGYPQLQ